MHENETTPLFSSSKYVSTDEDIEANYGRRSRISSSTSLGFANKALIIATGTLAILLFVIILDMSITALQIAVPAYRKPN